MDIPLQITDADVPDVIEGLAERWAEKVLDYDSLSDEEKLAGLLIAVAENYTRNVRRERLERALPEPVKPNITRKQNER